MTVQAGVGLLALPEASGRCLFALHWAVEADTGAGPHPLPAGRL